MVDIVSEPSSFFYSAGELHRRNIDAAVRKIEVENPPWPGGGVAGASYRKMRTGLGAPVLLSLARPRCNVRASYTNTSPRFSSGAM
jgi:hypothetical protein